MALSVLSYDASLDDLLDANSFTIGELSSHELAAPFVPQFDAFQAKWFDTDKARTQLEIGVGKANGAVHGADAQLDGFVDELDRTALIYTKNDRKAPLYQLFFGTQPPHMLKRPVLSGELVTCRAWIPTLQQSTVAAIAALAPKLVAIVAAADAAIAQQIAADQALKDFDTIGPKKSLIDDCNALRKGVHGDLSVMPHQNPSAMLPADFADRFFPHESHAGLTSMTNPKDVQAKIDGLKKDTAAAEAHLAAINAKAEAKAAQKKAEADAAAAVAAAKADEDAAKQKVKDAEKALKDAKKKKPAPPAPPVPPPA